MPDHLFSQVNNFQTHTFDEISSLSREQVSDLLNSSGRFSIDGKGDLVVVNPQEKPDNWFIRFLRALLSYFAVITPIIKKRSIA